MTTGETSEAQAFGGPLPPWQDAQWRNVSTARAHGRMGHALLLSGLRGTGKRAFARRLAASWFCAERAVEPCGRCAACRQIIAGAHPGLNVLSADDDKRDISIDAVRALCASLAMTSHDGGSKIAIIDPVDALNRNGVNALLKTLEEPSPESLLLLISENPLRLPATLRSRCQSLRFPVPSTDAALHWLAQVVPGSSVTNRCEALRLAHGAPWAAVQLLQSRPELLQATADWHELLQNLSAGRIEPLAAADRIASEHTVEFVQWVPLWLRDRLRDPADGGTDQRDLARTGERIVEAARALQSNARPQLVLESLMIDLWRGLGDHQAARIKSHR